MKKQFKFYNNSNMLISQFQMIYFLAFKIFMFHLKHIFNQLILKKNYLDVFYELSNQK